MDVGGGSDGTEKSIEWVYELCKEGFQAEGKNYKGTPVSGAWSRSYLLEIIHI